MEQEREQLPYPGLGLVAYACATERQSQAADFHALDAKAAGVGAVAVALVALTVNGWAPLVLVGAFCATRAVIEAMKALSMRTVGHVDPWELREHYLMRGDEEARLQLVDSLAGIVDDLARENDSKAEHLEKALRWLKRAVIASGVAVLLIPVGRIVEEIGERL